MTVPVKPTEALEKHVSWAGICDQQIVVDIERLLRRLRRDVNDASPAPTRPEDAEKLAVEPRSIFQRIAAVMEKRLRLCRDGEKI